MDTPALSPARPGTATERSASGQRSALERERLRIQAEIVSYPMPIPACDVYFNGLLEQRARICELLAALQRRAANGAGAT
jgi:hypothetical protein